MFFFMIICYDSEYLWASLSDLPTSFPNSSTSVVKDVETTFPSKKDFFALASMETNSHSIFPVEELIELVRSLLS